MEERAITLIQLRAVAREVKESWMAWGVTDGTNEPVSSVDVINLYDVRDHLIVPKTKPFGCSYVELVASGPQPPRWMVSHSWGDPVVDALAVLEEHRRVHQLPDPTAYWVCAYAMNHHKLSDAISTDLRLSPFHRATQLAEGLLLILDPSATALGRMWCQLEVGCALQEQLSTGGRGAKRRIELGSCVRYSGACILCDGPGKEDHAQGSKREWKHAGGAYAHQVTQLEWH